MDEYIKSNMCMLPWTSVETRPGGEYRPCCVYKDDLKDAEGETFTTKKHTISDVMGSQDMQDLRESFKRGEKPAGCVSCWKEEATGKTSKRQHMWYKAPQLGQLHVTKDLVAPRFIDLKLGNICNLKCRICSPHSSSQWVNDMIKLDPSAKKKWKDYNNKGSWPRQQNVFMEDIENHIGEIMFFEITGGEPLMIKQQFDVLKKCVDKGVSQNIEIHYNTNGTQFPEEAIKEIWPYFKRVEIAFSIDDIESRFEYQRHPAKWVEVNENIVKFKQAGLENFSMQVCTTINLFSMFHLDELASKVKEWDPEFWHINVLHNPIEFDIQQIPKEIKKEIAGRVLQCKVYKNQIQTAVDYMMHEPRDRLSDWHLKIKEKIIQIDSIRKENFRQTFPLLNKLLGIYE